MKTYIIFDQYTDEILGEVKAYSVEGAEWKAYGIFDAKMLYALNKENC